MLQHFMRKRNDHQIRSSRKTKIYTDSGILLTTKIKTRNTFFIENVINYIVYF